MGSGYSVNQVEAYEADSIQPTFNVQTIYPHVQGLGFSIM